jgi:hypothetical protein
MSLTLPRPDRIGGKDRIGQVIERSQSHETTNDRGFGIE